MFATAQMQPRRAIYPTLILLLVLLKNRSCVTMISKQTIGPTVPDELDRVQETWLMDYFLFPSNIAGKGPRSG